MAVSVTLALLQQTLQRTGAKGEPLDPTPEWLASDPGQCFSSLYLVQPWVPQCSGPTPLFVSSLEKNVCDSTNSWVWAKGWCFLTLKTGLVPLPFSIWMPLNFTFFRNFKLVLHSGVMDWFVSNCPGFLGESVLPAVLVLSTLHKEEEMGGNLEKPQMRCSSKNCLMWEDLKEIHREPTCNFFF